MIDPHRTLYVVAPAAATPEELSETVDAYLDPQAAAEVAQAQSEHIDATMTVHAVPVTVDYSLAVIFVDTAGEK